MKVNVNLTFYSYIYHSFNIYTKSKLLHNLLNIHSDLSRVGASISHGMPGNHNLHDNDQYTRSQARGISDMKGSLPHQTEVQIWTASSQTFYHLQDLMCSNVVKEVCVNTVSYKTPTHSIQTLKASISL